MRVEKPSPWATVVFDSSTDHWLSTIQGKTMAKPFQALLLWGYTKAIITPGPCAAPACVRVRALARLQVLELKPCQSEITTDKIQERQSIASAAIWKRANQCTDWLSVTQNGRVFQHHARIEPVSPQSLQLALTTKPWVRINLPGKMVCHSSHLDSQPWTDS